jgi:hypothetical protein
MVARIVGIFRVVAVGGRTCVGRWPDGLAKERVEGAVAVELGIGVSDAGIGLRGVPGNELHAGVVAINELQIVLSVGMRFVASAEEPPQALLLLMRHHSNDHLQCPMCRRELTTLSTE